MRLVSWNVNGLRSVVAKGAWHDFMASRGAAADVICLQETRCAAACAVELLTTPEFPHVYASACECAKGYSGVALLSKRPAIEVSYDLQGAPEARREGRIVTATFPDAVVVCCYVPNSKPKLERLAYRLEVWGPAFRAHVLRTKSKVPVFVCGDMNVAHQELDIHNPGDKRPRPGYTDGERTDFGALLSECKLVDSLRSVWPKRAGAYSWWSNFAKSRERNKGWRIDYVLSTLAPEKADVWADVVGSDHAPVWAEYKNPSRGNFD